MDSEPSPLARAVAASLIVPPMHWSFLLGYRIPGMILVGCLLWIAWLEIKARTGPLDTRRALIPSREAASRFD